MYRFTVKMKKEEVEALEKIAACELRDFRSQAALIIRQELEVRGLLDGPNTDHQKMQLGSQKDGRNTAMFGRCQNG